MPVLILGQVALCLNRDSVLSRHKKATNPATMLTLNVALGTSHHQVVLTGCGRKRASGPIATYAHEVWPGTLDL